MPSGCGQTLVCASEGTHTALDPAAWRPDRRIEFHVANLFAVELKKLRLSPVAFGATACDNSNDGLSCLRHAAGAGGAGSGADRLCIPAKRRLTDIACALAWNTSAFGGGRVPGAVIPDDLCTAVAACS